MSDTNALLLTVTCPDTTVAQAIADTLVSEQLAACVQLLPGIRSTYRWQSKLEQSDEVLLLIKTLESVYAAVEARIVALHPYNVPEILGFRANNGFLPYLDWIQESIAL